ncbi:ATP-binding protein [Shewanella sp. 3B26]|jgi:predicted kinase|uniref:ATP-binding protein n=1 Tax=Shewanella zhuhaiensis TaxID=2919576 RepID=A0AAJ1EY10_9GAMM|nr:ATP-binding protein [Shewanella zhuhaiensis]MCH4294619.1 ATP-binding protein [Shewanella zhuhaiensis]
MDLGKLFFFCGKMGAGKSTMAREVAARHRAVCISEDDWLAAHYPDQIHTFDDYLRFSSQIKPFIKSHVQQLLQSGTPVVMDFPGNTVRQRGWFVALCNEIGAEHQLIYLDHSDQSCLANIAKRRQEQPHRASFDTEAVFYHVSQFFEPPGENEQLKVLHIGLRE